MNLFEHLVGHLGRGVSPTQGHYLHTAAQHRNTRTHVRATSGIRTCDPNVQAAKDSTCLRLLSHWDWQVNNIQYSNKALTLYHLILDYVPRGLHNQRLSATLQFHSWVCLKRHPLHPLHPVLNLVQICHLNRGLKQWYVKNKLYIYLILR